MKPVSLELGGKAPFIVLPDADVAAAVAAAATSRYMNCGQVCIANERTFVHAGIYDRFVEEYVDRVAALVVGDPRDRASEVGPKISDDELAKTMRGVADSTAAGARVRVGGSRLTGGDFDRGYWMAPTVLTDVTDSMPAMTDELFGPVTPISPFRSWAEVRDRANATGTGCRLRLHLGPGQRDAGQPGAVVRRGLHQPGRSRGNQRLPGGVSREWPGRR